MPLLMLFLAIALDGQNCELVIAYAFASGGGSYSNWLWFFTLLHEALTSLNEGESAIITNHDRGVEEAIEEVVPPVVILCCCHNIAQHVFCLGGPKARTKFWSCVYAANPTSFLAFLFELQRVNFSAGNYVDRIPHLEWAHYVQPVTNVGFCTANMINLASSFLAQLGDGTFLEELAKLYNYNLVKFDRRLRIAQEVWHKLFSLQQEMLQHSHRMKDFLTVKALAPFHGLVYTSGEEIYRVLLPLALGIGGSCTCGQYQHIGVPCLYVVAFIEALGRSDTENYIYPFLRMNMVLSTYSSTPAVVPLQGLQEDNMEMYSPPVARSLKRATLLADLSQQWEVQTMLCRVYLEPGHTLMDYHKHHCAVMRDIL